MDWNSLRSDDPDLLFTRYTERYFPDAADLPRYLADFAKAFELRIAFDAPVIRIVREAESGEFVLSVGDGTEYRDRRVIMATGVGNGCRSVLRRHGHAGRANRGPHGARGEFQYADSVFADVLHVFRVEYALCVARRRAAAVVLLGGDRRGGRREIRRLLVCGQGERRTPAHRFESRGSDECAWADAADRAECRASSRDRE